ncbi:helix-turn-helix domain-containing protein [Candidatus Gottesmanbacteria bacterium]|nr:helix-turn-helix domain-containing protein [Candidatus Gottesmanbacteria bacterium]
MPQFDRFFTVKEIAELLQLSSITVYEFIKSNKLQAIQFGRSYRVHTKDLDKFIRNHRVKPVLPSDLSAETSVKVEALA